jgi:glycosyltransferase involved in cell wall biosynthesis
LNEPDDLRQCLSSLVAQASGDVPFEIIVVDNGSRILPVEVCSAFENVRLERELTPGPGPARSRGAELARGEIVSFIDADCVADAGWIRGIAEFFDRNPGIDILAGDIGIARSNPDVPTAIEAYESIFSYRVSLYVERDRYAATGNMSVRRDVFRAVGPFGGIAIAEDKEWGQRAAALGFRLAYAPDVRVVTPSCKSFAELTRRWDRIIAQELQHVGHHRLSIIRWLLRTLAVAMSPLVDIAKILRSDRLCGLERALAFVCLTRVRLYRARKMLALAFRDDTPHMVAKWNRESPAEARHNS